jgi:hypothetical protein
MLFTCGWKQDVCAYIFLSSVLQILQWGENAMWGTSVLWDNSLFVLDAHGVGFPLFFPLRAFTSVFLQCVPAQHC